MYDNNLIFGLDIGTRSIVGIVGTMDGDIFNVIASCTKMHTTRSMIDGQIHDINEVAKTIVSVKEDLEKKINKKLKKVCIAAAGRVLKTATTSVFMETDELTEINEDKVLSLELAGMEKAMRQINESIDKKEENTDFYCVGSTVIKYYLNGYEIKSLLGHKAKNIACDIISTFLPKEVVESLYKVIEIAGLSVYSLTLEPIAAIEVAIPEEFRLLNIALVDIGAGTSDIAVTKDGSIVSYGMISVAGDELTEKIVEKYLVDFATAEKIKIATTKENENITFVDAMGLEQTTTIEEVNETIKEVREKLANEIGDKIIKLNGDKPTNAVFVVGGGGMINGFTEELSEYMGIMKQRVAIRGSDVLKKVTANDNDFRKNSEYVTPVGICLVGIKNNQSDFIKVYLNDEEIKIYNNRKLTIMDVVAHKGINPSEFIAKRGDSINYKLNGVDYSVKGESGKEAHIYINKEEASLTSNIENNDFISIVPAIKGKSAKIYIKDVVEECIISLNGDKKLIETDIKVNNLKKDKSYGIDNGDNIEIIYPNVLEVLNMFECKGNRFFINEQEVTKDQKIGAGDKLDAFWDEEDLHADIVEIEEKIIENTNKIIKVSINGEIYELSNKSNYVFVDIFEIIDFDTTTVKGKLVTLKNGKDVNYLDEIKNGDILEIYWN